MSKEHRPRLSPDEWELIKGIRDAGKEHGVSLKDLDHGWLKSKGSSVHFRNPLFKPPEERVKEIDFDSIVAKYILPVKIKPVKVNTGENWFFDRLVTTDVHIGMEPNENGFSLYGGKWDDQELLHRADLVISHVLENQKSNVLLWDDLGDLMDGYDAMTVRKGHTLPQNMDNEKAFDTGLKFKMYVLSGLVDKYNKIVIHNVCNDNHGGSFGYAVNSAFKAVVSAKFAHVEVINMRRFIEHYHYGNFCFLLCHGKDGKNLKFGFKPKLDPKQVEVIKNYIDEHYLLQPGIQIEFSKGDSHQFIFDDTTCDAFAYYNYPAFSPSSEWVQTNYKKGKSGFVFTNYREDGRKSYHPFLFKWNANREDMSIDFSEV